MDGASIRLLQDASLPEFIGIFMRGGNKLPHLAIGRRDGTITLRRCRWCGVRRSDRSRRPLVMLPGDTGDWFGPVSGQTLPDQRENALSGFLPTA